MGVEMKVGWMYVEYEIVVVAQRKVGIPEQDVK